MNGDAKIICERIDKLQDAFNTMAQTQVAITTKVDLRHDENVRYMTDRKKEVDMMFKIIRDLPCREHTEKLSWLVVVGGVFAATITGWLSWLTNLYTK